MGKHRVDISERISVLDSVIQDCARRLLAVATPEVTMAHVDYLRQQANDLLAQAERIESALHDDTLRHQAILSQGRRAQVERELLVSYRAAGIQPSIMLERAVDQIMQNRGW